MYIVFCKKANIALKGAGFEGEAYDKTCELLFLDIDNIHVSTPAMPHPAWHTLQHTRGSFPSSSLPSRGGFGFDVLIFA